ERTIASLYGNATLSSKLANSESKHLLGREGTQMLNSPLGLWLEQQQECVVALLYLMSNENDDSKWVITAAGGIHPLV
ncbi:hypothetical protein Tco_1366877, partial [Tanacetum coccineum]